MIFPMSHAAGLLGMDVLLRRSALTFALLTALVAVIYPTFDYDLYWHLANGREMWVQRRILQEDVFSFTHGGEHFRNAEWLAQLIFYCVWSLGGMMALFGFKLVLTVTVVLLCWRTLTSLNIRPWAAAVLIPLAVITGFYRFIERPELFSLLGVAVSMAIILRSREGYWPRRVLYLLPFVMASWEWLHGAVFGMSMLVGAIFAENFLARWYPSAVTQARAPWRSSLNRAALLTVVVSLLNPHGLLNYGIFAPVISNSAGFSSVIEWAPPGLRDYWLFFMMFAAGLLGLCWQRAPQRFTEFLWFLGFGVLACRYSRVTGVFAIVALPWLAVVYGDVGTAKVRRGLLAAAVLLLGTSLYVHKFSPWSFVERRFGWQVLDNFLPVGSVRFALDHVMPGPLYNTGHFGGYLAFRLYPAYRIFQYNLPKIWGETYTDDPTLPSRYGINWAIVGRTEELQRMFPRSGWAYLFREGGGVLAVRRSPENAELIRRFEVRYFQPGIEPERLLTGLSDPVIGPQLAYEAAVYCSYRRAPALCLPVLSRLQRSADAYAWAGEWLPKVLKRQTEADTL